MQKLDMPYLTSRYNIPEEIFLGGDVMKGKVRSRDLCCQKCGQRYEVKEGVAIFCRTCLTKPDSFFVQIYWQGKTHKLYKDRDGKRMDSYKAADQMLTEISGNIQAGIFILDHYLPKEADQFRCAKLLQRWLLTKANLAPTTLREIKRYERTYFTPYFGAKLAMKLTAGDIEDFLYNLPKHLSMKTKKNILTTLRSFFSWLHRRETINRIPLFPVLDVPESAIEVITPEAMAAVIEQLDPHHQPIFMFLAMHPIRTGEARALKTKDFDLDKMTVHIERAFSLKEIRHRKNKRDYYLPIHEGFDTSVLSGKLPEAWVFTNKAGHPYTSEGLRRRWHEARVKAGVPNVKLYNATRHSFATNALWSGHSLQNISKALGHSDSKSVMKYAKHDVRILRGMFSGSSQVVPKLKAGGE